MDHRRRRTGSPAAERLDQRSRRRRTSSARIESLDVLRGIAIVGTLASNVWMFTAFTGDQVVPDALTAFCAWLPNGKFLGLLMLMFGVGVEIQRQAARRHGRRWPGSYLVRAALLFADGLLNYVLVVQFDVLRAYAVVGFVVAFLLLFGDRVRWWTIGVFFAAHVAVMTAMSFATGRPVDDLTGAGEGAGAGAGVDAGEVVRPEEAVVVTQTGMTINAPEGYLESIGRNAADLWWSFAWPSEFVLIAVGGVAVFLLGAQLFRAGLVAPEGRRLRRWLVGVGLGVGLPLDYVLANVVHQITFARYGSALIVALGILALVAEFYQHRRVGAVGRQLQAVGRMALSCYVLQNVLGVVGQRRLRGTPVATLLDSTTGTLVTFVAIVVVMVLFSRVWLTRFSRGPIEFVWHTSAEVVVRAGRWCAFRVRSHRPGLRRSGCPS